MVLLHPAVRPLLHLLCLTPLAWLVYAAFNNLLGANPAETLIRALGDWALSATATPAAIMGLGKSGRIEKGAPADLIVFKARNWSEFLSRNQADRTVIRRGTAIDTTAPDFAELDGLMAGA